MVIKQIIFQLLLISREHSKMASRRSSGRPSLDTQDQKSLLKLLQEGQEVCQIDIDGYLFEDFWKQHAKSIDLLASIKDKNWKKDNVVSDSDFNLLGKEIELNINKLMKDGRSSVIEGEGLLDVVSIISDALANHCKTVTPLITISQTLQLRFRLSFGSPSQMAEFLQRNYKTRLWEALEQCRQSYHPDLHLKAEELTQLGNFIDDLKRRQLGLIKSNNEYTGKAQGIIQKWGTDLTEVNKKLQHDHVLSMKTQWDCGMLSLLHFLYQNWDMYRHFYYYPITNFVILNLMRSSKLSSKECISGKRALKQIDLYQAIYPGMNYIIQRFRLLLGINLTMKEIEEEGKKSSGTKQIIAIKGYDNRPKAKWKNNLGTIQITVPSPKAEQILKKLQIEEALTDRLFHFFLDKQRMEAGRKTSIDIHVLNRETVKLKELIGHCLQFYIGMSRWSDLFSPVSHYFKGLHNQITKPNQGNDNFLENIQQQQLPNMRCLGCSPFFYYKSNIYCQSANQSTVRVFPSIHKLKDDENAVKDEICGMLNSGGGFIFFDCERSYRQILALGQKISQKEKQECEQRIQSYIRHFYPKVDLQSQISISFVPLVYRNQSHDSKENYTGKASYLNQACTYKKHQYLDSVFVTRIKVVSLDPSIVYFWQVLPTLQNKDIEYRKYCQVASQSGKTKLIGNKEMLKLIKLRMRRFYIPQKYIQEQDRRLLKNKASLLDHVCEAPDIGSLSLNMTHPQHQKKPVTKQQKYDQMCLIVTKRKSFPRVQQFLNANGIPCEIVFHFEDYHFSKLANTGVLYHNSRFQDIVREVSQPTYKVANKSPLVINVTPYLKLQKRNDKYPLSEQDFRSYCKDFFKEFPNEYIKAFQFITGTNEKEYYLTTKSKLSTVFMYFFLDNYNQTVKLKNPLKLDRMSEEERAARFTLLFQNTNGKAK